MQEDGRHARVKKQKKLENLREQSNFYVGERKEGANMRSFRHFKIGSLRILAGFFIYKVRRSKNHGLLSDNIHFEEEDEFELSDVMADQEQADFASFNPED